MDFDVSKENIQPLKQGRNAHQLDMALQAQTNPEYQMQLQQQKEEFEKEIRNYQGDDPLEPYYNYITWIEQSYPKSKHEANNLLEHCLGKFENDPRYNNDIRFLKLCIKYIDTFPDPLELYHMMQYKRLCTGLADFYKAWAYYYEASGDFSRADMVFQEGKKNLAQPFEELETAHKNLIEAAGLHVLYGPNRTQLEEKRQALTSLKTYGGGRVPNVRVGATSAKGVIHAANVRHNLPNVPLPVYEDESSGCLASGAFPKSIITMAKRQEMVKENTLKPGPWTSMPHKKRVLASHKPSSAGFVVLEDDEEIPSNCLPPNMLSSCLEDYSNWHVAIINFPDEPSPNHYFGYPKHLVYAELPDREYSIEEIRARRYQKNVQPIETKQAIESILIDDDGDNAEEDDCIIVVQDPPAIESTLQAPFQIYQGSPATPPHQPFHGEPVVPASTITHSPWKSQAEHQSFLHDVFGRSNEPRLSVVPAASNFTILEDPVSPKSKFALNFTPEEQRQSAGGFAIYEQSMEDPHAPPKGNAMKTTFRTLNADEVETGSRGGMDGAMAAQPADGAKPMIIPFDDSSCSNDDAAMADPLDSTCSTQQFNFNINNIYVSTPQSKNQHSTAASQNSKRTPEKNQNPYTMVTDAQLQNTRKSLFNDNKEARALSTILEERTLATSSSCSSGATTKSSVYGQVHKVSTISEEHNSYLEQNLKVNEALRRSLLGFMDAEPVSSPAPPSVSPMQSTPIQSPVRTIPEPNRARPLDFVPTDPFDSALIDRLLQRVNFPGVHSQGFVHIEGNLRLVTKKQSVYIGRDMYIVKKQLGKGQFGTVFKAWSYSMNSTVALKHQKMSNKWEFYICRELQARLAKHPLKDRFMDISIGYFSDQSSVLVSQYQPHGTLLNAANSMKTFNYKSKETICVYFTLDMLRIVQAMHEVKIIHADIKPDNFMLMLLPDDRVVLQLIDFGSSIDMTLFPANAMFTRPVNTENFICSEMQDGLPWSYHTDLFCLAATSHVLLFQDYIQTRKSADGAWSITTKLPRYFNQDIWNLLFNSMLNQQSGLADLATLIMLFEEELAKPRGKRELISALHSLINHR